MGLYKLKTNPGAESGIYVAYWIREAKLWCVPDAGMKEPRTASLMTDDEFTKLFTPHIKPNDIPIPQ